jgi:hypothetical protein
MFFFLGFDLELTIDRVLIETDGPRLCAGIDLQGQRWLVFRSCSNAEESRWLCSPITDRALRQVETGRAKARDALRHSSTGLVEVVSYTNGGVVPERCFRCAEIPESLLPPADLRVRPFADSKNGAGADPSPVGLAGPPTGPRRPPRMPVRGSRTNRQTFIRFCVPSPEATPTVHYRKACVVRQ